MKVRKNIVHYRNITLANGESKDIPTTVGVILESDSGHFRMKINYIPTEIGEDGLWFDLFDYEPKRKKEQNPF